MPWPTYTERFLHAGAAATATTVVPAGKRWVIKSFNATCSEPANGWTILLVHGQEVARVVFPAPQTNYSAPMTLVAYAGEEVKLISGTSATRATISGYEFDDPTARELGPAGTDDQPVRIPPQFVETAL